MKTIKLKDALTRALEGGWVAKAALFTTFNFEPRFFENYVLPLLLPDVTFGQNALQNAIRWRYLYCEPGRVPHITVYADQYAKSNADAPMLDYKVHTVMMPGKGANRGAFHPKLTLVLAQREEEEKLIVVCGSGNISEGGWCKNSEAFVLTELKPGSFYPRVLREELLGFIETLVSLRRKSEQAGDGEKFILNFFQRRNRTDETNCHLYHSGRGTFPDFLEEALSEGATWRSIEVFSPYFSPTANEVAWLSSLCPDIRLQIPMVESYCAISEETYNRYAGKKATWYFPADLTEGRWCHAKVYRFIRADKPEVITIIGSVNLTAPGWAGLGAKAAIGNMEAALLLRERTADAKPLLQKPTAQSSMRFMPQLADGPENESTFLARYETPEILFTLDWGRAKLSWQCRSLKNPCTLVLPGFPQALERSGEVVLTSSPEKRQLLKALAKDCLLRVMEQVGAEERYHFYYPVQVGFPQKPFPIRLTTADILLLWDVLGADEALSDEALAKALERVGDRYVVDESGCILERGILRKSLLNEVARNLSGLVRLENYLLRDDIARLSGTKRKAHQAEIVYYLTVYNLNTLPAYIAELEQRLEEGDLAPGFLFIILTLLQHRFYNRKSFRRLLEENAAEHLPAFTAVENRLAALMLQTTNSSTLKDEKKVWFRQQLAQA